MMDEESRQAVGTEISPEVIALKIAEMQDANTKNQRMVICEVLRQQIVVANRRAGIYLREKDDGFDVDDADGSRSEAELIDSLVEKYIILSAEKHYVGDD